MSDSPLQPILCLLGHPAAGSPMQLAMERAFYSANLDWRYLTLDVLPEQLGPALAGIAALGFHGAHLTGSLTKIAKPLVQELLGSAALAQWVDCVTVREDAARSLIGENIWGRVIGELAGKPSATQGIALLSGDGSAMVAVAAELAMTGWSKIFIESLGADIVDSINAALPSPILEMRRPGKRFPSGVKLLVHGLADNDIVSEFDPTHLERLPELTQIIDLARPQEGSLLVRAGRNRGIPCVGGLEAMVHYTASCFRHWTGVVANQDIFRETFEEYYDI